MKTGTLVLLGVIGTLLYNLILTLILRNQQEIPGLFVVGMVIVGFVIMTLLFRLMHKVNTNTCEG